MSQQTRIALVRPIIYLVAAACVAVVSMGAIWWEPYTGIQYAYVANTCKTPYSSAWGEPASGPEPIYWVMRGQVVSVWISGVEDWDYWYDNTNASSHGYAADVVPEQSVIWDQRNGSWWVDENENNDNNNNNNNNAPGPGRGYTVNWIINNDATDGWVRLVSLDDVGDMGNENGECYGNRKDGPQAENVTVVNFRVFEISGPSELWYWGDNMLVSWQYALEGEYSVPLCNSQGTYDWDSYGSLKIRQNASSPWSTSIIGLGVFGVQARFDGKIPGGVRVTYQGAALTAYKDVNVRYPKGTVGIDWSTTPSRQLLDALGCGPFNANRAEGKHYDTASGTGFKTLIGYHLQDQGNCNVPYYYWFQEYFTSTNNGNGWRVWPDERENWPWAGYVRDGSFGGGQFSSYASDMQNVWLDAPGVSGSGLIPEARNPAMPSRTGGEVDYVEGLWTFGRKAMEISTVYTYNCNWHRFEDHARHY